MLNYRRINRYLSDLLTEDLIEHNHESNKYNITAKGIEYLQLSEELANYISPVRSMITKYESLFVHEEQLSPLDIMANRSEHSSVITISDSV
jgi:predicted transcriptional regulator